MKYIIMLQPSDGNAPRFIGPFENQKDAFNFGDNNLMWDWNVVLLENPA